MAIDERYRKQVSLLVQTIPAVAAEDCFALKRGTAINLFVRNMPRLSVDIAGGDRGSTSAHQGSHFADHRQCSCRREPPLRRHACPIDRPARSDPGVKIEVTPVLRGCVFAPEERPVSEQVEENFGFAEMRLVSFADLYAGKIMAALDRQHPRDLFDVRDLLTHEGISDDLRKAFIVYLISHDSPIAAVLGRGQKDIAEEFRRNFQGMIAETLTLEELLEARRALVDRIVGEMPTAHREFLVSFKVGMPDWDKLGVPGAPELPAVKWKQLNLDKLGSDARKTATTELAKLLGVKLPA